MKKISLINATVLLAGSLLAADSSPKDDVLAATKKLGDQANYSWKTTVAVPESAQFKPGPSEGQTEKDGVTHLTLNFGDNSTQVFMKGDKAAVSDPDGGWQALADLDSAEGPRRFLGRIIKNFKVPAAQAAELAAATKELKKDSDVYSGDMTEDGAKAQFRFGTVSNPKGSVKFWVKDGALTRFEFKVTGKVDFNGNEFDVDRLWTTEIKDAGSTKLIVPEEAKKKL
ncbi:MAG TPA: hypothetical protein VN887_11660 [Candidatus Angelobacter sp.]|nr:hypothetical protein [Candidatus Angelobacter sp.]